MQGARLLNKARAEKNSKNRNKQTSDQEHEKKIERRAVFFFDTSFIQSFDIKFKVTSLKNGLVFSFCFWEFILSSHESKKVLTCPQTITSVLSKYGRTGTVETLTRSGRKRSFTNRDWNDLKRLVKSNRRLTLQNITAKLNECKTKTFSHKTVQRLLHSEGYERGLAKKKMVVREANRKKRVKCCQERRGRTVDNYWKNVMFLDESQIVLGTNNHYM